MDEHTEIVRKCYDDLGATYDVWAASVRIAERIKYLNVMRERFATGSRILDLGCGTGLLSTKPLAETFDVVGIDVSARQIAEARRNVAHSLFICADIQAHKFDPGSFDGIVSFYCLNHVPRSSYAPLLRNFHGWLSDGGLMILSFVIEEETIEVAREDDREV